MRIKNVESRVESILENEPDTRNSDLLLYRAYLMKHHVDALHIPITVFLKLAHEKRLEVASIETVGRCRRKIMERRPELRADADVEAFRELNEEKFKDYSRS